MNRQQFIRTTLFGLLPLAVKPSALFNRQAAVNRGSWPQILQHALMCPSVHNIQPWKVRIDAEDRATVFFDSGKQIPYSDKNGAFMTITMSMFVETIAKVSETQGFRAIASYESYMALPLNQGLVAFAVIRLVKSETDDCLDVSALYARRTARFGYANREIAKEILAGLSDTAEKNGRRFSYTTEEAQIAKIMHLDVEALFEDLYDDSYRNELRAWIRTGGEDKQMRDGLSAACFGQPDGITRQFFEKHRRYTSDFKKYFLKAHYRHSLKHTRTIFWLSGDFSTYDSWLQCGRALLAVWLQLASLNLYIQPFGNLITNENAHRILKNDLLGGEEDAWFIARIGYCDLPPASVRKSLQDILTI